MLANESPIVLSAEPAHDLTIGVSDQVDQPSVDNTQADQTMMTVGNGKRSEIVHQVQQEAGGEGEGDRESHSHSDCGSECESDNGSSSTYDSGGSWHSDEYAALELDYDALRHVARYYLPGNHGKCIDITNMGRGSYHEIRVLHFDDGWTCSGRFTRDKQEDIAVTESELATREHVLKHTSIPVPQTYYVNLDPTHPVGAPFVLMEHMQGHGLYKLWKALETDFRLDVLSQITEVIAQLARLHFARIGSLKMGDVVGPLQNVAIPSRESGRGPYTTTLDYLLGFLPDNANRSAEVVAMYTEIRAGLKDFMSTQADNTTVHSPYRLIHGDFDAQNMLFIWESPETPPKLSGVIDWDCSYTGPLYNLCEYPTFIQDNDLEGHLYEENKVLRKGFVRMLAQRFPKRSRDREEVRECFRRKTFALNGFFNIFASYLGNKSDFDVDSVGLYLEQLRAIGAGTESYPAYNGRHDYAPDSELESDEGEQED